MLLSTDWSQPEIETVCRLTEILADLDHAGKRLPLFSQELFYALFFDQSTRTKSSWAGSAARLGASPVIVDGSSTQVSHGETSRETGAMLGMNAHALGIRHDLILGAGQSFMREAAHGIDEYLAATGDQRAVPIVNLQCDVDHPTQTLADLCWLRERFSSLAGKTIAVSWAYSPSYAKPLSVPQGLITLLSRFGTNIRLAHPPGYQLFPESLDRASVAAAESGGSFAICDDMDEAFAGADIVYPKSWGPHDLMLERVVAAEQGASLDEIEARSLARNREHRHWICNERRMKLTASGSALYMHCLPADIGAEVTTEVMDKARIDLARQANKKVYTVMALLMLTKLKGSDLVERVASLV